MSTLKEALAKKESERTEAEKLLIEDSLRLKNNGRVLIEDTVEDRPIEEQAEGSNGISLVEG